MIPGDKACYPGSDVLINKFEVRDPQVARAIEYKFASVRELELHASPIQGKFDFQHLQDIHKHVFQDMYEWAGQPRKIDFAKRNQITGYVNRFVPEMVMDLKIEDFNAFIAEKGQLKGLSKPDFVKGITEVHTKLNELHPFREGNGRSTRIFLQQLAHEAGYVLDMEKIDKDRWNLASHKAQVQHHPKEPDVRLLPNAMEMRQIFHESLQPTMEHAFTHEARENAIKIHPDLKVAYTRLDAIEKHANASLKPDAAIRLVAAERERIVEKLKARDTALDRGDVLGKLLEEKTKLGGGKTSKPDGYEVVASVLQDVLKQKGLSPAAIEKTMADATRRLNMMRDAGVPAPGFRDPDRLNPTPGKETKRGPENSGPQVER